MNEDVLGPRQEVLGQRYDRCSRCGAPAPLKGLTPEHLPGEGPALRPVRPAEATREGPPALLCAACARDVARGEPLDLDAAGEDAPA